MCYVHESYLRERKLHASYSNKSLYFLRTGNMSEIASFGGTPSGMVALVWKCMLSGVVQLSLVPGGVHLGWADC